jgi:aminopeptidase N
MGRIRGGVLTYYEGGLFYDHLRKLVGNGKFLAAMRSFLQKHPYETVSWPGPVAALMNEPGVAALWRRWVEEALGLPLWQTARMKTGPAFR